MNGAPKQKSYHEQMTVMLVSLAVSAVLLGLKVWAAEITGSSALYSDAAESIVHLIAVVIAAAVADASSSGSISLGNWQTWLIAGAVSALPPVINYLNPADSRYGNGAA